MYVQVNSNVSCWEGHLQSVRQMSREARKPVFGISNQSDTNWRVQSQKKVRILKLWVEVEEELYYLRSENKDADQLCSNCTADLRLSFRIGKNPVFS